MDFKTFTNNLSNYSNMKRELERAKQDLEVLLYDLSGVKGVGYEQVTGTTNESVKALKWLTLDDKYNSKLNEVEYYERAIKSVDDILKRLPTDLYEMLMCKFVVGMTYEQVGRKFGYSNHGMWQYLKRETERFL